MRWESSLWENARGSCWRNIFPRWTSLAKANYRATGKRAGSRSEGGFEHHGILQPKPDNRNLIKKINKAGVHPKAEKREVKSQKLAGKSFVFTGGLANRSREEAGELVLQHGGKVSGSVSKKTDYVVVGTDPGSKYDKAKELGVAILTESDFEKLLRQT